MTGNHEYLVKLNWVGDRNGIVHVDGKPSIKVEPPIGFGGGTENWSPEDLLLAALASCMMATFFSLAKAASLEVQAYDGVAQGALEKTKHGYGWQNLSLEVKVEVDPKDEEKTAGLVFKAKRNCIIANALKPEVQLTAIVNGTVERADDTQPVTTALG
ncbi:MAG: OsmC family protein [Bdellovibrionia bacterium]